MTSTEDMEKPAKRWEVAAVSKQQEAQSKQLETIDTKIDLLLSSQVTTQYVDDKVKVVDKKIDNEVQALKLRYDPTVQNVKWLFRTLVVAIIGLIGSIVSNLWNK